MRSSIFIGLFCSLISYNLMALPNVEEKKSLYLSNGGVVELIQDSESNSVFYRLPSYFAVSKTSEGYLVDVQSTPQYSQFTFNWQAENWTLDEREIHQALQAEFGGDYQLRVLFPELQMIGIDLDLEASYGASVTVPEFVGAFLPDSQLDLIIRVPNKHLAKFRKAIVQGNGFFFPLQFTMTIPDPLQNGKLIQLPYSSTLFIGGLSLCSVMGHLNCPGGNR